MKYNLTTISIAAILSVGFAAPLSAAQASGQTQIGMLDCTVEGGKDLIIKSVKTMTCVFERTDNMPSENYSGEIKEYGIQIGETKVSKLKWAVFAPSQIGDQTGLLAGDYGGVSGEATVGVGLGANILIGGSDKSIALQPFSVQTQKGLNIEAGIAKLVLTAK
jgi:hypothetical protein